jgi:hypothetical protein
VSENKTAVYIGRRMGNDKKPLQVFLLPDGKEVCFRGIRGVSIGSTYECSGETMKVHPKLVADVQPVRNSVWEQKDLDVEMTVKAERVKAQLQRNARPNLDRLVSQMRPFIEGMNFWQKKAFVEQVLSLAEKP